MPKYTHMGVKLVLIQYRHEEALSLIPLVSCLSGHCFFYFNRLLSCEIKKLTFCASWGDIGPRDPIELLMSSNSVF